MPNPEVIKFVDPWEISMWVVAPIRATLWSLLLAGGQNHVSSGPTPCGALPCSVDIRPFHDQHRLKAEFLLCVVGAPKFQPRRKASPGSVMHHTTITSTSWRQQRMRYGGKKLCNSLPTSRLESNERVDLPPLRKMGFILVCHLSDHAYMSCSACPGETQPLYIHAN